jgi:hypothetical protein
LGRDKYIADVDRSCRGAVRCLATARYRACSSGRRFDESAQRCVAAASVDCQQAALARTGPAATCTGGPTPDGTCGAGRPGNYCCKAGQCCSLYGICGWTTDHCDVTNGCQVMWRIAALHADVLQGSQAIARSFAKSTSMHITQYHVPWWITHQRQAQLVPWHRNWRGSMSHSMQGAAY